jgi:hypothetical protein
MIVYMVFMTGTCPGKDSERRLYDRGEAQGKMAGFEGSLDRYTVENLIRGVKSERIWPRDSRWKDEGKKIFELELRFLPREFHQKTLSNLEHEIIMYRLFVVEKDQECGRYLTAPYICKKEIEINRHIRRGYDGPEGNVFAGEASINRSGTPFKPMNRVYTNVCTTGNVWVPGLRIIDEGIRPADYRDMLEAEKTMQLESYSKIGDPIHRHIALALDGAMKGFGQY